jgi:P4 family phage/plasmid primase-like protien
MTIADSSGAANFKADSITDPDLLVWVRANLDSKCGAITDNNRPFCTRKMRDAQAAPVTDKCDKPQPANDDKQADQATQPPKQRPAPQWQEPAPPPPLIQTAARIEVEERRYLSLDAPDDAGRYVLSRDDWQKNADALQISGLFTTLIDHNDEFFEWRNGAYWVVEKKTVKAQIRLWLERQYFCDTEDVKRKVRVHPNNKMVEELFNALLSHVHKERDAFSPPAWLTANSNAPPARTCISLQNGIFHPATGRIELPSSTFFTRNALPFSLDYEARCLTWYLTLGSWWPRRKGDPIPDEILLLQEIMGYLLLPDTSLHKVFAIIGPTRSGKSTIAYVIEQLLGEANVGGPSMHDLASEFGRQSLIGKLLAIISETTLGRQDDPAIITSVVKAISGEDKVEINRKGNSFWVGRLPLRFLFLSNKMITFKDDSGAMAGRMMPLIMTQSFLHREDIGLKDKLKAELPGIFLWALDGLKRLIEQGHFTEPQSTKEARNEIARVASPVKIFIEERCILDGTASTTEQAAYLAYQEWSKAAGQAMERKTDFVAAVLASQPAFIRRYRPGANAEKYGTDPITGQPKVGPRSFKGIRLADRDAEIPF